MTLSTEHTGVLSIIEERPDDLAAARSQRARAVFGRLTRHPGLLAGLCYTLLAILADYPIWPGDPNQVPTQLGGDIVQTAWFLYWTPYAILHGHNPFYTNLINYPQGVNLAQNTGMQLLALLTAPLSLIVNPVASENLLRFLAFPLSAYAAYWVISHWTRHRFAAFLGGLLYGFSPYMVAQGEFHLNLIFVPFPPLILYALFELVVAQQQSARRWGVLLAVFCVCQFFISAEVLTTTALIGGLGVFYLLFFGMRHVPRKFWHAFEGLAVAAVVAVPFLAFPVFEMLRGSARYVGPAQGFNNVYNADLLGAVIPTHFELVAPARLSEIGMNLVGSQVQENGSYLGIPLIILTAYFVLRYWRRLWPPFLALMAATAFVFSLGPTLIIDGRAYHLPVALPFAKIDHLPLLESILPVRLALYVAFFVAVIIAIGVDRLLVERAERPASTRRRLERRAASRRVLVAGLVGLVGLVAILPRWPYRTLPVSQGVHYSETAVGLSLLPKGSVVLTYPYPTSFFDLGMFWQVLDHMNFKLLGSYALVPDKNGSATIFPTVLQPKDAEAMLVNSVTLVADPELPDLVATEKTIDATQVVRLAKNTDLSHVRATLIGKVGEIDYARHRFFLYPNHYTPVAVHYSASTSFVGVARGSRIAGLALGQRVAVDGTFGPGTVTPQMVGELRSYLANNHVTAVILGLGITDGAEMANWFRAAIGQPTRGGGGAMIWTEIPRSLRCAEAGEGSLGASCPISASNKALRVAT